MPAQRTDSNCKGPAKVSAGGTTGLEEGRTSPVTVVPPSVTWPQSLPQNRLENAGPAVGFAPAFLRQQLPRPRQQERLASLNTLAASGARDAKNRSDVRHADTAPRAIRKLLFVPRIPGTSLYHAPVPTFSCA